MKKYLLILLITISAFLKSFSQTEKDFKAIAVENNAQKTASSKDIITTFFRASIDNLLGDDHSFTFNSSFYGIDSIFRKKGSTISYERERSLRQKTFNIALTGDDNHSITRFSGGFTFTLVNKKDIKLKKLDSDDLGKLTSMSISIANLKKGLIDYIGEKYKNEHIIDSLNRILNSSWNTAAKNHDFSKLRSFIYDALKDSLLIPIMKKADQTLNEKGIEEIIDGILKGIDPFHETYKSIAQKYSRKPLWTFSPTAAYDRINKQGEYSFVSEFTVGLGKNLSKKPWEVEIKSAFTISNDTSIRKVNYENKPLTLSLGINKVWIENGEKEPKMEFKFFTQYDYQLGNVPAGKDAGVFTLNTTLRINVFKSLWLPITVKYDPENGNFLGLFAVTANLGN